MEDPVVLLERNLYGHPLAGVLCERQFEKLLLKTWMGENSKFGMSLCSPLTRIRVEYCAFLEVIRLFQEVGRGRNKFQFLTVQQNPKSFPSTQD